MELYKELLLALMKKEEVRVIFPQLEEPFEKAVQSACYRALQAIKRVLEDDSLEDEDCFARINVFEQIGSDGGARHDFG